MIKLEHISKSFGEQKVLEDISMTIEDGDKLCIVGKSGSGKSVLMKLMTGLLELEEGKVSFDDREVGNFKDKDWNALMKEVGVVFQNAALFDSLTVLENVGIRLIEERKETPEKIRELVWEGVKNVGLGEETLEKYPSELSGGMQKRVGIARAVIHHPRYLFYDEPTTGLDPLTAETIDALIEQEAAIPGRTSIIITHDLATVRDIANKVAMIHEKKLRFFGTPGEFFNSQDPIIQRFLKRNLISHG
jgi:phospholipid/cholesterol/gamma-HCH transport system ATP-binding protein